MPYGDVKTMLHGFKNENRSNVDCLPLMPLRHEYYTEGLRVAVAMGVMMAAAFACISLIRHREMHPVKDSLEFCGIMST